MTGHGAAEQGPAGRPGGGSAGLGVAYPRLCTYAARRDPGSNGGGGDAPGARVRRRRRPAARPGRPHPGVTDRTAPLLPRTGTAVLHGDASADQLVIDGDPATSAVLHRDLHDGQVLVDGDRAGLLDLDTLAVGDPALDLGNLLAHLDLPVAQNRCSRAAGATVTEGVMAAYGADEVLTRRAAVHHLVALVWLRCVYALRPGPLAAAGRPTKTISEMGGGWRHHPVGKHPRRAPHLPPRAECSPRRGSGALGGVATPTGPRPAGAAPHGRRVGAVHHGG